MWYGLRKLVVTMVLVLSVCAMPAFMSDAAAKGGGGKGGGKGGSHAKGHHHHHHHHHHHRNHNYRGRYWYNGSWYYYPASGSNYAIYTVYTRPSASGPWQLAGSYNDMDEAESIAADYRGARLRSHGRVAKTTTRAACGRARFISLSSFPGERGFFFWFFSKACG